jgi:hypothetical protein
MKRALALLVGGVLILGSALAAHAQAPTVSFGGQMRVYGFVFNNITDFTDSGPNGANRDSQSFYFQRWRLFTNVESADKKARAVWGLEVGDITWGRQGGASGGEYLGCNGGNPLANSTFTSGPITIPPPAGSPPGTPPTVVTVPTGPTVSPYDRTRQGGGGCLGADGVNVETKHAYIFVDTGQWVPGSSVTIGIQNVNFMTGPIGGFFDDDAGAIKLNMKFDPVDVEVYTAKAGENALANADDTDFYVGRVGMNITKELRATVEGMLVDEKSLAGFNIGDTFWVGATVGAKLGTVQLDGAVVYGTRSYSRPVGQAGDPFQEEGFGGFVTAQVPVGPVNVFAMGWYTTGDDTVGPAGCGVNAAGVPVPGTNAGCGAPGGPGVSPRRLPGDSDKLPVPESTASWFGGGGPYIAEWLFGNSTIGAPGIGQAQYADPTGTYGFGGSATYALTPAFSLGGGAAYVGATDQVGPYGDYLIEVDAGAVYRFNPNLVFTLFGGVMFPDSGDTAWGAAFRTQYSF